MAAKTSNRMIGIDALRGIAIILMVIFHFVWTLGTFGVLSEDFVLSQGWRRFGLCILGMFLSISGFVSFWSWQKGLFTWPRFFRRIWKVAAAAVLISIGSYIMSRFSGPSFFVFFGVLHHITLGLVLLALMRRFPTWLLAVSMIFCFVAPMFLCHPLFNAPASWWLGLWTEPVGTVDYVPLLPWFWMMIAGALLARLAPKETILKLLDNPSIQSPVTNILAWMGRHSLLIYLIHPPILFGLVALWVNLF